MEKDGQDDVGGPETAGPYCELFGARESAFTRCASSINQRGTEQTLTVPILCGVALKIPFPAR